MIASSASNAEMIMPDLYENTVLRSYLSNVRNWHGYIRFLGLRDLRDNPDLVIDRLFVDPLLTRRHVSPDESPARWIDQAETAIGTLAMGRPLVLLGDPGAGKSTLVNYIVWLLSRPGSNPVVDRLGWRLPVPMVLRELRLRGVNDFDGLIDAFLEHAMSKPLRDNDYLRRVLGEGRALVVLDGVDEIGDKSGREDLRRAVFEGIGRYPGCSWMMTSRIVGYSEAPFDGELSRNRLRRAFSEIGGAEGEGAIVTRFLAPFDDQRIAAFARRWYVQRVAGVKKAESDAADLVKAIHEDEAILRLARVPNLLTMMALIHRVEGTLPHGRALLYERIAEAYLESIDKFRGIYSGAADLPRKKTWLARVAFEMQCLRAEKANHQESDIVVDTEDVLRWLEASMEQSGAASGVGSAAEFLDYVGRRSGLFLPRGEGRYAFIHLSFQEYFAAVAMEREVTSLDWARDSRSSLGLERTSVAELGLRSVWRETLVFLFELLSTKEDWHNDLLACIFGGDWKDFSVRGFEEEEALNLAFLLARLAVNQQSGISVAKKGEAIGCCVRTEFGYGNNMWSRHRSGSAIAELLGDDEGWNGRVVGEIIEEACRRGVTQINLSGTRVSSMEPVRVLRELRRLNVADTHVSDLEPLRKCDRLRWLDVGGTLVSDVSALAEMCSLIHLGLARTKVSDVSPLRKLTALRTLYLWDTDVADVGALSGLKELQSLSLIGTGVDDLSPLAGLLRLRRLLVSGRQVSDIQALARLPALRDLYLGGTQVRDFSPLVGLEQFRRLSLMDMEEVTLTEVGRIGSIEDLRLSGKGVSDIRPLARLASLKRLFIYGSRVNDLSPLMDLESLEEVLLGSEFAERAVRALQEAMPECKVRSLRVRVDDRKDD